MSICVCVLQGSDTLNAASMTLEVLQDMTLGARAEMNQRLEATNVPLR